MRGLLCIEHLYHQIVAGRKTQTRRSGGLEAVNGSPDGWELAATGIYAPPGDGIAWQGFMKKGDGFIAFVNPEVACKPRYKVGEVLYLKEPTAISSGKTFYKYDCDKYGISASVDSIVYVGGKWSNKLFMPAKTARAFIKITGIKCERLLDISNEDCIAEGIESEGENTGLPMWKNYCKTEKSTIKYYWADATASFLSLYRFANKIREHGHIGNPWVWAYTFEYLKNYKP